MIDVLLPLGLAFIMFSLGLSLRSHDFMRALRRPTALALGLVAQILLLPLTAFVIAVSLGLSPDHAVGLMILAACPGGVTAGIVTFLARGDTALSISLSALTSLLAFVTVPLVVEFSLFQFLGESTSVRVPAGQLAGGLVAVTLLPVGVGMLIAANDRLGPSVRRAVQRIATFVFVVIVTYTFVVERDAIAMGFVALAPACFLLNAITMMTGAVLGKTAQLDASERVALAMECGMQNSALGITLSLTLLAQPNLAVPSVVYALVMNVTAFSIIVWRRRLVPLTT